MFPSQLEVELSELSEYFFRPGFCNFRANGLVAGQVWAAASLFVWRFDDVPMIVLVLKFLFVGVDYAMCLSGASDDISVLPPH